MLQLQAHKTGSAAPYTQRLVAVAAAETQGVKTAVAEAPRTEMAAAEALKAGRDTAEVQVVETAATWTATAQSQVV